MTPKTTLETALVTRAFALEGAGLVWIVETGKLDVFLAPMESGSPAGALTHVTRVEAGGGLFALPLDPVSSLGFLAVPAAETVVQIGSLNDLSIEERNELSVAWIEAIARQLPSVPEGLSLDAATGGISGSVEKPQDVVVHLTATNAQGSAHSDLHINVGDTIQGGDERTMETEWEEVEAILAPFRRYKILLTPGNHDVWSPASARAYVAHSKRPLHYGFDYKQVHITVLDNSRTDDFPAEEMAFLKQDLALHEKQPVKFIFSHRPSWILQAVLGNPAFPLHQLAIRYGVKYVIAGHIHQMLHFDVDGVTYLSMASSGGHLREDKSYERGWFFQHTLAHVSGDKVNFAIKELPKPFGKGRVTTPADWGAAGLVRR